MTNSSNTLNQLLRNLEAVERRIEESRKYWRCHYSGDTEYFKNPLNPFEKIAIAELDQNRRRSHP